MNVAPAQTPQASADYARRLFDGILDWYKAADVKAQLILAANGTFLTVVAGVLFANVRDVRAVTAVFGPESWVLLAVMALSLIATFLAAVLCLHSRTLRPTEVQAILSAHGVDPAAAATYDPSVMWFFQLVARLEPPQLRIALLAASASPEAEIAALADESVLLARNVVRKHRWVNLGFALTCVTLLAFVGLTASYVIRIAA